MVEQDSEEEDEEPGLRIHSTHTAGSGGLRADDDILPISGLLLGRLQSSMSTSNLFGESGRYGEEEHIYQGGPAEYEEEVRRNVELAQSSDYMEVDNESRDRSATVFEVIGEPESFAERPPLPRGKCCGRILLRLVVYYFQLYKKKYRHGNDGIQWVLR